MMGNKKNLIIDISLAIAILIVGVFIYREISRLDQPLGNTADVEAPGDHSEVIIPSPQPQVNDLIPMEEPRMDFKLEDLSGRVVSVSDHRDKGVMVNFWATWCPPCRDEMPLIQKYADRFSDDLVVLAVNLGEDEETVRNFIEEFQLDLIVLLDPTKVVASLYRIHAYPTTMFIDQEGVIRATHIGELNELLLTRYLAEIGIQE